MRPESRTFHRRQKRQWFGHPCNAGDGKPSRVLDNGCSCASITFQRLPGSAGSRWRYDRHRRWPLLCRWRGAESCHEHCPRPPEHHGRRTKPLAAGGDPGQLRDTGSPGRSLQRPPCVGPGSGQPDRRSSIRRPPARLRTEIPVVLFRPRIHVRVFAVVGRAELDVAVLEQVVGPRRRVRPRAGVGGRMPPPHHAVLAVDVPSCQRIYRDHVVAVGHDDLARADALELVPHCVGIPARRLVPLRRHIIVVAIPLRGTRSSLASWLDEGQRKIPVPKHG